MFWLLILFGGLGVVFFKLGAMSVVISALKIGLLIALLIISGIAIVALWRRVFRKRDVYLVPRR